MDPITTALVAAATAGATAGLTDTAKAVIADAYTGLKALIKDAFGAGNSVAEAAERLETKPDSEGRKLIPASKLWQSHGNHLEVD